MYGFWLRLVAEKGICASISRFLAMTEGHQSTYRVVGTGPEVGGGYIKEMSRRLFCTPSSLPDYTAVVKPADRCV